MEYYFAGGYLRASLAELAELADEAGVDIAYVLGAMREPYWETPEGPEPEPDREPDREDVEALVRFLERLRTRFSRRLPGRLQ